jgi:glycosyltransferase involved in cell wall biosynthesis
MNPASPASKVLIITYYWPPSGGAGVQRWLKFVKYLPEMGYEPIVITVDTKYASYAQIDHSLETEVNENVRVIRTKSFEPYNLYKKVSGSQEVPFGGFANESKPSFIQRFSRFIRGNMFIPDPRKGWNKYVLKEVNELLKTEKIEAVITSSPPHSTQLIGLQIQKKYGIPWIADLRDPWTDIYYYDSLYHLPFAKRKDASYELQVLENADAVLVVSPSIKRNFLAKSEKLKAAKIHIIPNGFDNEDFASPKPVSTDKFELVYTGTMADSYNITSFLEALETVSTHFSPGTIKVSVVGIVAPNILNQINDTKISSLFGFKGYLNHSEAIDYMSGSSALWLVIPEIKNNEGILTGKLFEYLATGKPIIGIGPVKGDAAEILNRTASGKMFESQDAEGMAEELKRLIERWKLNKSPENNSNAVKEYSRRSLTGEIASILSHIIPE